MFFHSSVKRVASVISTGVLVAAGLVAGQEQPGPAPSQYPQQQQYPSQSDGNGSWTSVGQNPGQPPQQNGPYNQPGYNQPGYNQPGYNPPPNQAPYGAQSNGNNGQYAGQPPYNQAPYNQAPYNQQGSPQRQPMQPVPAQLNVPVGTFVTVRVNQTLSSDHNQPGDGFSATMVEPLVVNGVVVAEPGQTIGGQVVEAKKAGRIEGTARLGIQLTDLTLVDGQQVPVRSALVSRKGPTSIGRDAGAIAGTTGLGAAIGAAAGSGPGAAIGAGAGAVVGTVGVLLTRGHPSIIVPEQILTFRIEAPISIDTTHATQAFHYVEPNEYDRPVYNQQAPYAGYNAPVAVAAVPYYSGYGYPYYYPYGYGSGFSFFLGSGYYRRPYYGGFYGGRGYYGSGYGGRGYYGGHASYGGGGSHRR